VKGGIPRSASILVDGCSFAQASAVVGGQASATLNWKGTEDFRHPENTRYFPNFGMDGAQVFSLELIFAGRDLQVGA